MKIRETLAVALLCAAASAPAYAEAPLLDAGFRQMYDLQFAEAHRTFEQHQRDLPDDPMGPVSDAAAYLFSEFDRLHILQSEFFTRDQHFITDHKLTPDPALKKKFEAALDRARILAARSPQDENAIFASLLAKGLRSDYSALIDKRYVASFKEMKAARMEAERLIAANPRFYDAWLAVGVENYMLSVKPVVVRWFLRLAGGETSREVGIEKLRLAAEKGHYLAPFAKLLLAVAALRDGDRNTAHDLLAGLVSQFPRNHLYREELARLSTQVSRTAPVVGQP
jgi:hypothetical protein